MNRNLLYVFLFLIACSKDDDPARKSVTSVAAQEQITVAFGTLFSAISFPDKVIVTYSDNTTESVPASFSLGNYNNSVAGLYELEGTLTLPASVVNPQNLKAVVVVKVEQLTKSVVAVATLNQITVPYGTLFAAISFPSQVSVTYSDNSTENVSVSFSAGSYNSTEAGIYELQGSLTLPAAVLNPQNLKATIAVKIASLKLRTVTEDGVIRFEYFYDEAERLDRYRVYSSPPAYTEYTYYYLSDNKIEKRIRNHAGLLFPEKYFYNNDGTLNRIEFYSNNDELSQTHSYTNSGNTVERIDNSDQSINGLKYRTYEYDAEGNVKKVVFDFGNTWTYTYYTNQKIFAPLKLDPANPLNQVERPIETFSFVQLSSYTSVYVYNVAGYPTKETRTFPGDNDKQVEILYTYE